MAQRNPMNDRYQGDGPQGKTRKSAAKLKPATEAASSVHVEKKPTNKQERKAARKKRDAQMAAKEKERQRKAEEREREKKALSGEEEEPKKQGALDKIKSFLLGPPKNTSSGEVTRNAKPTAASNAPDTPEYRKLRKIYWILMGVGVAAIAVSFYVNFMYPERMSDAIMYVPMAIAYISVISALILDFTKIKKMQKAHLAGTTGKKSPKQLKHEQERAEAAALLEEAKKAQKEQRRAQSKIPFVRGKTKKESTAEEQEDSKEGRSQEETEEKTDSNDESSHEQETK